jgi:hypothetical protein
MHLACRSGLFGPSDPPFIEIRCFPWCSSDCRAATRAHFSYTCDDPCPLNAGWRYVAIFGKVGGEPMGQRFRNRIFDIAVEAACTVGMLLFLAQV